MIIPLIPGATCTYDTIYIAPKRAQAITNWIYGKTVSPQKGIPTGP